MILLMPWWSNIKNNFGMEKDNIFFKPYLVILKISLELLIIHLMLLNWSH